MFRPELVEADADDDEATEDMSIYRRMDDEVSEFSLFTEHPYSVSDSSPIQ